MKIYRIEATKTNTVLVTGDTGISSDVSPDDLLLSPSDILCDDMNLSIVIAPTDLFGPVDLIYAYNFPPMTGESSREKSAREWIKRHMDYDIIVVGIDTVWINTSTGTWWVAYQTLRDRWKSVIKPVY